MNLFTEKSTKLIYDVAYFGDTILVRPVSPGFETHVQRMDMSRFTDEYEEYSGNYDQIRESIGATPPVQFIDPGAEFELEEEEEGHE